MLLNLLGNMRTVTKQYILNWGTYFDLAEDMTPPGH